MKTSFVSAIIAGSLILMICGCASEDADTPSTDSANTDDSTMNTSEPVDDTPTTSDSNDAPTDQIQPENPPANTSSPESVFTTPPNEPAATDDNQSSPESSAATASPTLEQQLAEFQVPPAWLADVELSWDVQAKPWSEGRQEIRRLLGENNESARQQGIRLTWDYLQKEDIGDGHEYGMYMYLGGEPVWAVHAYREWLPTQKDSFPVFAWRALAALYTEFGEFEMAKTTLETALARAADHQMATMRRAELNDSFGDLYVAWGQEDLAKKHYGMAVKLYPQSKPKYGRHLLPRRAKKVQAKLDALSFGSLTTANLKDGQYSETALGYSGDVNVRVHVDGGRVTKIGIQHQEKIDQNACVLIPDRIIEAQSLKVDGISGATVTKDAIVSGTFRALKKAGL